jgi:hypothetical protein
MKGAKELAEWLRKIKGFDAEEEKKWNEAAVYLDRLAAIDEAIPSEVGPIRARHENCILRSTPVYNIKAPEILSDLAEWADMNRGTLLAIIDRQAKEFLAGQLLWKEHMRQRDEMKAELATIRAELDRLNERLRMAQHGEAESLKMMGAETVRAQALAVENARLANEVGILTGGIAAYRSGSYTLTQVWENGDGKQVPR